MNTEQGELGQARSDLASDIRDLKAAGNAAVATVSSKLPWVVGGAVALVLVGVVVRAAKPRRRYLFEQPQRSFVGTVARAAALSAASILARRYVARALNSALPERDDSNRVV